MDDPNVGDLEDFVNKHSASRNGLRPIVRSFEVNKENYLSQSSCPESDMLANHQQEDVVVSRFDQPLVALHRNGFPSENIDRNVDYRGWLQLKKRKWKEAREERKRRR